MTSKHENPSGMKTEDKLVEDLLRAAGPRQQAPDIVSTRVRQAVHAEWQQLVQRRKRSRWMIGGTAMAASILAAFIGIGMVLQNYLSPAATLEIAGMDLMINGNPASVGDEIPRGAKLGTGNSPVALRLANGASMRLDVGTEIVLDSTSRSELLAGAVYIDSGEDSHRNANITINTPFGAATDIGTQFEVRTLPNALKVSVREGLVELATRSEPVRIDAGAQVKVDSDGITSRLPISPTADEWNWTQTVAPVINIEGQTLETFLRWVSRETGMRVQTLNTNAARSSSRIVLHGSIDGLTPLQAIDLVFATTDLDYEIDGGVLIIQSAE